MTIPNPALSSVAAQHVKRVDGDFKISVPSGNTIYLDTGVDTGLVYITGDLTVQGNTTTVNTTNVTIEDNIIVLNKGESGIGVTLQISGIEIDRGTATKGNAQLLWDETVQYYNPITQQTEGGVFEFRTKSNNALVGIRTNSIDTNGLNLGLINKGTGIITVTGTTNYEQQVLNYSYKLLPIDDDIIPNIRAVVDKIDYQILNNPSDKIQRDDTEVRVYDNNIASKISTFDNGGSISTLIRLNHPFITNTELNVRVASTVTITNSGVTHLDGTWPVTVANPLDQYFTIQVSVAIPIAAAVLNNVNVFVNDSKSWAKVKIDGAVVAEFQNNQIDFFGLRFEDTTIQSTVSNTDLILISPGTGSVQIQDNLKLANVGVGLEPANPPSGSLKVYSNPQGPGGTGIYFVNDSYAQNVGDNTRDELISKKKAIAFAILM